MGTWIEIGQRPGVLLSGNRRSLRGNVDRNFSELFQAVLDRLVVPYVGTWIEICTELQKIPYIMSFPTWERG